MEQILQSRAVHRSKVHQGVGLKNLLPKLHQGVGLKNLLPLPIVLICLLGTRTNSSTCLEIGAARFESRVLQYVEMALRRD